MEQFGGPSGFMPPASYTAPLGKYPTKQPSAAYPSDGGRHATKENPRPAEGQAPRQSSSVPSAMASKPIQDPEGHSAQPTSSYCRAQTPRSTPLPVALDEEARLSQYEVIRQIGAGRFGEVFIIRHKATKALLCWKLVFYKGLREKEKKQLVSEVNVMRELRHANIVRYHDRIVCRSRQCLYIVMEYCDAGDLAKQIEAAHKHHGGIDQDRIVLVVVQLIHALAYCHEGVGQERRRVLHRDLKPCNIFLASHPEYPDDSSRCIAKLGDFGLSRHLNMHSMAHSCVGTPYYWSPELLEDGQKTYNVKSDMWALGCVIYEMCTGKTPFAQAQTMPQLKERVRCGPVLPVPGFSDSLNALMASLLQPNPNNRPSALQCLGYTIFRGCSYTPPPLYRSSSAPSWTPRNASPARGSPSSAVSTVSTVTTSPGSSSRTSFSAPSSHDAAASSPASASASSRYQHQRSSSYSSDSAGPSGASAPSQKAPGPGRPPETPSRESFDLASKARPGFFAEAPPPHAFAEASPPESHASEFLPPANGAANEARNERTQRDRTRRAASATAAAAVSAFERQQREGRSMSPDPSAPLASIEEEEEGEGDDAGCGSLGSGSGVTRRMPGASLNREDRREAPGLRHADTHKRDDRDGAIWTGRREEAPFSRPGSELARDFGAATQNKVDTSRFSGASSGKPRPGNPQNEDRASFASDTSARQTVYLSGLSRRCSEPPAAFHSAVSPWDPAPPRLSSAASSSSSSRAVSPSSLRRASSREMKYPTDDRPAVAAGSSGVALARAERGPEPGAPWGNEETEGLHVHGRPSAAPASSFSSERTSRPGHPDEARESEHCFQGRGRFAEAEASPATEGKDPRDSGFEERSGRRDEGRTDGGEAQSFGYWPNGRSDEARDRLGAPSVSPFSSKRITRRSSTAAGLSTFASPSDPAPSARAPAEWRRGAAGSSTVSAAGACGRFLPSPRSWQGNEKSFPSSSDHPSAYPALPHPAAPAYPEPGAQASNQFPRRRQSAFPSVKRLDYEEEHASSACLPTLLSPRFPHHPVSRPAGGVSPRSSQRQALAPTLAGMTFERRLSAGPLSSAPFSAPQERTTRLVGHRHALAADAERAEAPFSHAFRPGHHDRTPVGARRVPPRAEMPGVSLDPGFRTGGPLDRGPVGSGGLEGQSFDFAHPTHASSEKKEAETEWSNPTAPVFYSPRSPRNDLPPGDGARSPYSAHLRPGVSEACSSFSVPPTERYEDDKNSPHAGSGGAFSPPTFGSPAPGPVPVGNERTFGRNPSPAATCASFSAKTGLRTPAPNGLAGDSGAFRSTNSLQRTPMSRRVSAPFGAGSAEGATAFGSRYASSGSFSKKFPQGSSSGVHEGGGAFGRRQEGDVSRVDAHGSVSPRSFSFLQRSDAPLSRGQPEGSHFQKHGETRASPDFARKGDSTQTHASGGRDFSQSGPFETQDFTFGEQPTRETRHMAPSPRGIERGGPQGSFVGHDTSFSVYAPRAGHAEGVESGCSAFEAPSESLSRRDGEADRENTVPNANGQMPVSGMPASKQTYGDDCDLYDNSAWTAQKHAPENFHAAVAPYPSSLLTGFAEGQQKAASRSSCLGGDRDRLEGAERSLR
ncbi:NIMA-related protein kinase NIMA1 [Toxoplasma gondii FOU]|uniref:non-specific serine/threonine protein kinase n=3 Tax=Toxoplasma gondii TaxID=5811 RepID=A0A086KBF7_TOXGO|nr:NIMA-related protein kinase NIMA1 [Toxoplasma gondii FOU]RQX73550.1 NIMA-related protein kinase NIMA1 [Toxoplasma gondii CAST]